MAKRKAVTKKKGTLVAGLDIAKTDTDDIAKKLLAITKEDVEDQLPQVDGGEVFYPGSDMESSISLCLEGEIPAQCGIDVLHDFPADCNMSKKAELELAMVVKTKIEETDKYLMATLIQDQKESQTILKALGFVELANFVNPGSGNTVTIFGRKN